MMSYNETVPRRVSEETCHIELCPIRDRRVLSAFWTCQVKVVMTAHSFHWCIWSSGHLHCSDLIPVEPSQ